MKGRELKTPLTRDDVKNLNAGDIVYLTGNVFTARDKAHKRILDFMRDGKKLPFELDSSVIYHCGPLVRKKKDSWEIVSAGPTTSARMDEMSPEIIKGFSVKAIIGKGGMNRQVLDALEESDCVYLAYTGGAGALAAEKIAGILDVFWLDLSAPEAVWALKVVRFGPLVVAMDANGESLYTHQLK